MTLRFSRASEIDLAMIGDFIARDSPRRALSFVRELRGVAGRAERDPDLYPLHSELTRTIRRIVHGHYAIYYSADTDGVTIERILHPALSVQPDDDA